MARATAVALLAASLLGASPAAAQSPRAEALFEEAQRLMKEGRHAEACTQFGESHRIEPGIGVLLYWADCLEKDGRVASAWRKFEEGVKAARAVGQAEREAQAQKRADALAPRLSRMSISLSPGASSVPGLVVRRDGFEVDAAMFQPGVEVDPGPHVVEASAPGHEPFRRELRVSEPGTIDVAIPALRAIAGTAAPAVAAPPTAPAAPPPEASGSWNGQKTAAVAVAGLGVVGVGLGTIFGLQTIESWADAESDCDSVPGEAVLQCGDVGADAADAASTQGLVSTLGFGIGSAALVGAAVLWITAPSRSSDAAVRLVPSVDATGAGATAMGRF